MRLDQILLENIKKDLPQLQGQLATYSGHWHCEDPFYRAYYGSLKVYGIQQDTQNIVKSLRELSPHKDKKLNDFFEKLIQIGTEKEFELEHNQRWFEETFPMINAFMHSKYFLELAVKYGKELERAPAMMPSGWAALLCLYRLR
jgi:hypothetical protein